MKVHFLVHHVIVKDLFPFPFKDTLNSTKFEEIHTPHYLKIPNSSQTSNQHPINQNISNRNSKIERNIGTHRNLSLYSNANPNRYRSKKVFLQFSEKTTKQIYCTNFGESDGSDWDKQIITFTFPTSIPTKTVITIRMFDFMTKGLISELPLPLNIIPFDKKVNSKFKMISKIDEDAVYSVNQLHETQPHFKIGSSTHWGSDVEDNHETNNFHFSESPNRANIQSPTITDRETNLPLRKTIPKIKLFLMIHLCTFGQLPFHAPKGSLLRHLKDETRSDSHSSFTNSNSEFALPKSTSTDSFIKFSEAQSTPNIINHATDDLNMNNSSSNQSDSSQDYSNHSDNQIVFIDDFRNKDETQPDKSSRTRKHKRNLHIQGNSLTTIEKRMPKKGTPSNPNQKNLFKAGSHNNMPTQNLLNDILVD